VPLSNYSLTRLVLSTISKCQTPSKRQTDKLTHPFVRLFVCSNVRRVCQGRRSYGLTMRDAS